MVYGRNIVTKSSEASWSLNCSDRFEETWPVGWAIVSVPQSRGYDSDSRAGDSCGDIYLVQANFEHAGAVRNRVKAAAVSKLRLVCDQGHDLVPGKVAEAPNGRGLPWGGPHDPFVAGRFAPEYGAVGYTKKLRRPPGEGDALYRVVTNILRQQHFTFECGDGV